MAQKETADAGPGAAGPATPSPRTTMHEPTLAEVAETLARHVD